MELREAFAHYYRELQEDKNDVDARESDGSSKEHRVICSVCEIFFASQRQFELRTFYENQINSEQINGCRHRCQNQSENIKEVCTQRKVFSEFVKEVDYDLKTVQNPSDQQQPQQQENGYFD